MKLEVSLGECIDKLSILEIKLEKIKNEEKLVHVKKEFEELNLLCKEHKKNHFYKILKYINETIWNLQEEREKNYEKIFDFNMRRFRIKKIFDLNSEIKEQKGYKETSCIISFDSYEVLIHKIPEINFLLTEYDVVFTDEEIIIQKFFPFIKKSDECTHAIKINLSEFTCENRCVFDLEPIRYLSSGMLGDYIQQMSVIKENFYETGRKGILYMTDLRETFRFGIDKTFEDTYEVISNQTYIESTKIHQGEPFDVDLSIWRMRPDIHNNNSWWKIFKIFYGVEWASKPWLNEGVSTDSKWIGKTLINTTTSRKFSISREQIDEKNSIFITNSDKDYEQFCQISGTRLEVYYPSSFTDVCIAINSCEKFIGSLSAFLTIAHALHKPRMTLLSGFYDDDIKVINR